MAKFKFRLATLLRLREMTRDERNAQLAQAYRADEIIEQEQQKLRDNLDGLIEQQREVCAPGPVSVDQLLEGQRYGMTIKYQQGQAAEQREQIGVEIQKRTDAVVVANRDVRALEKLQERLKKQHTDKEAKADIKQLDEVAQRCGPREDER